MLKLYGNKSCSKCVVVKNQLTSKGIPFEYHILADLSVDEQMAIVNKSNEKGLKQLPIIMKDEEIITIQEALKCK